MDHSSPIFSQLIRLLPQKQFQRCVVRYDGNKNVRTYSCWDQFLSMAFAQLTYRESLRDIEACLRSVGVKLYHLGIRGKVSRNTLAYANEHRDWRIFADFGRTVIKIAQRELINNDFGLDLKNNIYALDSTVIETCLSLFPWTFWSDSESKGGLKAHTLFDINKNIPVFIDITERKVGDSQTIDKLSIEPNAFYIMDRAYLDWKRLYHINCSNAYFILRTKKNTAIKRIYSKDVDKSTGVRSDQIVRTSAKNKHYRIKYPKHLRRISFFDADQKRKLVFLTNNFDLPPETIADLYKSRWQIELFFKWIKQNLRIKKFYGNSPNAVKIQIWVATTVYLLVAIAKKRFDLQHSHYTILQVLSVTLFEKKPILHAFSELDYTIKENQNDNQHKQLDLFGLSVGQ